ASAPPWNLHRRRFDRQPGPDALHHAGDLSLSRPLPPLVRPFLWVNQCRRCPHRRNVKARPDSAGGGTGGTSLGTTCAEAKLRRMRDPGRLALPMLLLVAAIVFLTGINWGLPSRAADPFLFGDKTP